MVWPLISNQIQILKISLIIASSYWFWLISGFSDWFVFHSSVDGWSSFTQSFDVINPSSYPENTFLKLRMNYGQGQRILVPKAKSWLILVLFTSSYNVLNTLPCLNEDMIVAVVIAI